MGDGVMTPEKNSVHLLCSCSVGKRNCLVHTVGDSGRGTNSEFSKFLIQSMRKCGEVAQEREIVNIAL